MKSSSSVVVLLCAAGTLLLVSALPASTPETLTMTASQERTAAEGVVVRGFERIQYPIAARAKQAEGVVVVRVTFGSDGHVQGTSILHGTEPFATASVENVKTWRFSSKAQLDTVVVFDFRVEGYCSNFDSHAFFLPPNLMSVRTCKVIGP